MLIGCIETKKNYLYILFLLFQFILHLCHLLLKKLLIALIEWLPRNLPCWFSISSFVVSVTPSLITPECSNNFVIFIISFISSFKINKVNPFPALTGPCPVIFLSNLFIAFEGKLFTNLGQLSLAKGIVRSAITFY